MIGWDDSDVVHHMVAEKEREAEVAVNAQYMGTGRKRLDHEPVAIGNLRIDQSGGGNLISPGKDVVGVAQERVKYRREGAMANYVRDFHPIDARMKSGDVCYNSCCLIAQLRNR